MGKSESLLDTLNEVLDENFQEGLEVLNERKRISKRKAITLIVISIITVMICAVILYVTIFRGKTPNKGYMKYIRTCMENLDKTSGYSIIGSTSNGENKSVFVDTIVGNQMYTEVETESGNEFSLLTWTFEDGKTYSLDSTSEGYTNWREYPEKFNEVANSAKLFDLPLWVDSISSIKQTDNEDLELGLEEKASVSIYEFTIPEDKVTEVIYKKLYYLYEGLLEEYEQNNSDGKYDNIIADYREYLKSERSKLVFKEAVGKIGIYDNKPVLFTITLTGGGTDIEYSKIIAYDSLEKRAEPTKEEIKSTKLSEFVYETYNKN